MAEFACARRTDLCTGHGCFPPRPAANGSPDVYANDLEAHRIGDSWLPHCCGPACHGAITVTGSSTVFTNDISQSRITEQVSCGSTIMTGSPNVFIGD
jgi:uncharacterized Zn-binding protein involved in type VI secretion